MDFSKTIPILVLKTFSRAELISSLLQRTTAWPPSTAATPAATLKITYSRAVAVFPPFIRSPVSRAKDENVVKPPHIPTFKNSTTRGFRALFFKASPAIRPMIKEPNMFMAKVFTGKARFSFTGISPMR